MADDGSAQSTTVWPLPKFRFEVKWDSAVMSFQRWWVTVDTLMGLSAVRDRLMGSYCDILHI